MVIMGLGLEGFFDAGVKALLLGADVVESAVDLTELPEQDAELEQRYDLQSNHKVSSS